MLSIRMTIEPAPAEERQELQQQLLRIAGGEREALAELYQHTRLAVYGLALSYLKNVQDAQDLTQDVYVQVWNCAEQYRFTDRLAADGVPQSVPHASSARKEKCCAQRGGMECHSGAGVRTGCR